MSRPQYIFAISLTSPGISLGKKLSILVKYSHKGTNIISTKVLDTKEGVTSSAKVWMSRPQENVPSARFFETYLFDWILQLTLVVKCVIQFFKANQLQKVDSKRRVDSNRPFT